MVAYLTQLLDKGLFHADPHPGNMLRTPDGRLAILDFGLMTSITDDQRYGMVEAISHLVHRDYAEIGGDFQKLDFIPEGVDVKPIVPALSRVFDAALAGGGARGINFNELSADLAQITCPRLDIKTLCFHRSLSGSTSPSVSRGLAAKRRIFQCCSHVFCLFLERCLVFQGPTSP